jgi:hypothetical protein
MIGELNYFYNNYKRPENVETSRRDVERRRRGESA